MHFSQLPTMRRQGTAAFAAAAVCFLVAVPISEPSAAAPTDRGWIHVDSDEDADVAICAIDGVAVSKTSRTAFDQPAEGSTFSFSHVLTLHNYGRTTISGARLTVIRGRSDSRPLAQSVTIALKSAIDGVAPIESVPSLTLADLEGHPLLPVRLPAPLRPGRDLQIRLTLEASDLADSLQGTSIQPSFFFTVGA